MDNCIVMGNSDCTLLRSCRWVRSSEPLQLVGALKRTPTVGGCAQADPYIAALVQVGASAIM